MSSAEKGLHFFIGFTETLFQDETNFLLFYCKIKLNHDYN